MAHPAVSGAVLRSYLLSSLVNPSWPAGSSAVWNRAPA